LLDRLMSGNAASPGTIRKIPPLGVKVRHSTDTLAIDDSDVVAALRYIRDHACEGIQVGDVVRQTSVSRVTLENRFKRMVGRTMHAEIKRIQLGSVKHLLSTSDMPIHQIAERTGFEYAEYLSNLFHRTTGQTLGAFRKESRGRGEGRA
jgi:LacI family transcriptional regulator